MQSDGELIRAARERAGLSQEQLGALVGAHRASVGNWEKGTPPRNKLGKLQEVLGLDHRLQPLGTTDDRDFGRMDNNELVAQMNMMVAQMNSLAAEIAQRLSESEFDPGRHRSDHDADSTTRGDRERGRLAYNDPGEHGHEDDLAPGAG